MNKRGMAAPQTCNTLCVIHMMLDFQAFKIQESHGHGGFSLDLKGMFGRPGNVPCKVCSSESEAEGAVKNSRNGRYQKCGSSA